MEDNKDKEQENDFAELAVIEGKKNSLDISIAMLCGAILFAFFIVGERIYKKLTDNSVILVSCSKDNNQNKVTLLTNVEKDSILQLDNRVRQFTNDILFSMYPRFVEDIEESYRYVSNHTQEGSYLYDDYIKRLDEISHYKRQMQNNKYTVLYFDNKRIKIRKPQAKNKVQEKLFKNRLEILVDGYMHMYNGVSSKIHNPTIKFVIELVPSTIENPEGIEVVDFRGLQLKDPVTGKIELI